MPRLVGSLALNDRQLRWSKAECLTFRMDGVHGKRLIESVTWERDGDVLFVALPERVTRANMTFFLWMVAVAGLLGPGLHFVCPWMFSSDLPVIPLVYRLGLMGLGVASLVALPVLRWRHDRRLREELATCVEGPGTWAVELLVLGLGWYPSFPVGRSPRVDEVVRVWKNQAWKNGAPGTVVVNLPKVVGLTLPAGGGVDAAPQSRDWYYWFSKALPFVGLGWAMFTCVRTLILGNISTEVAVTLWCTALFLMFALWILARGPRYPGMSGLLAHTEPGQIRIKDRVFNRDDSVMLVCGMFGQCLVMLYNRARRPQSLVPTYFAPAMLPQLLRRWGEPRGCSSTDVRDAAGAAGVA